MFGKADRLNAHALGQRQHDRDEQRQCDEPLQVMLKETAKHRGGDSARDVAQKPGKPRAQRADRVALASAGQVHADQLEEVVGGRTAAAEVVQLVGVQFHVDHPQQTAIGIDHRKREKPVQHEKLAGIEHRRARREWR